MQGDYELQSEYKQIASVVISSGGEILYWLLNPLYFRGECAAISRAGVCLAVGGCVVLLWSVVFLHTQQIIIIIGAKVAAVFTLNCIADM